MTHSRTLPCVVLASVLAFAACSDPVQPPPATESPRVAAPNVSALTAQEVFARFVSLGTSNSMGVQSAGIFDAGQRAAWPAQLAARVGVPYPLPLIQDPGCGPPLLPPLAADLALIGAFGDDLVTAVMTTCAPLRAGITLPTHNLAVSGAKARDALFTTPETETARNARKGEMYSRVLPWRDTQVSAMLSLNPTFVSLEVAANEVLPASTGRTSAMTPYADWEAVYDQIVAAVKSTGAKAVLVGLPVDAANFPSVRRAREFFNEWAFLLTLGIRVSLSCYFSSNRVFVPGYLLTLIQAAPTTATCADVPGTVDYVLTSGDINVINAQMARMNTHIQAKATENGYAYFSLNALYGLPKPPFNMVDVVFSSNPFGPNISLDGVHPSALGQSILASAAVQAVNAKYGLSIP